MLCRKEKKVTCRIKTRQPTEAMFEMSSRQLHEVETHKIASDKHERIHRVKWTKFLNQGRHTKNTRNPLNKTKCYCTSIALGAGKSQRKAKDAPHLFKSQRSGRQAGCRTCINATNNVARIVRRRLRRMKLESDVTSTPVETLDLVQADDHTHRCVSKQN